MTLMDTQATAPQTTTPGVDPKGALLARVLELLDRDGLQYCILHGYDAYPDHVTGDVDILVAAESVPMRLAELLRGAQEHLGARVVQWFADRAHFVVLQTKGADGTPVMLQLHVSTEYDVADRLIKEGNAILRKRRRHDRGFWIPSASAEFVCILANRLGKGKLEQKHTDQLAKLWSENREGCAHEMFRFLSAGKARMVADAAEANDWALVRDRLPDLQKELLRMSAMRKPMSFAGRFLVSQARRVHRFVMPESGLHVVFLGPDGVGKSTTIETVQNRVADAFLSVKYQTFARSLLANKPKESPHSLPPRSKAASLLKVAWWLNCYTLGYFKSIHPTRSRGGLAINHRYLIDAVVDPNRYRYSGPAKLLWGIWAVAPKPDLMVFLDAPADVIWARKKETTAEETARQRDAYRALADQLPMARVVNTNQDPAKTIDEVTELILGTMASRVGRRFKVR